MASKKKLRRQLAYQESLANSWHEEFRRSEGERIETIQMLGEVQRDLTALTRGLAALYDSLERRRSGHSAKKGIGEWEMTLTGITEDQMEAVKRALNRREWSNWEDVPDRTVVRTDEEIALFDYYVKVDGVAYMDDGYTGTHIEWDLLHEDAPTHATPPFVEVTWANLPEE